MTAPMRLAVLAFSLVIGELAGFSMPLASSAWPWVAAAGILSAFSAWGWRMRHALPFLFFLYGMAASMRTECVMADMLERHWQSGCGGCVPVLELPVEGPVHVSRPAKGGEHVEFLSHLGVVPLKVVLRKGTGPFEAVPAPGERWRCAGWVSRQAMHPGRCSRRMFLGMAGGLAIRVAAPSVPFRLREKLSAALARRAAAGLRWCPEIAAINRAILLGRRESLPAARRRMFVQAGTMHVFAISGLHVMLMALMMAGLMSRMPVPVRLRGLVSLPFLAAYVVLTGMRPSAVRAAVMAGICLSAPAFGRKGDALAAWSVTALCIYGLYPQRIADAGCTLSFAAMFGIVAWLRWIRPLIPARGRSRVLDGLGVSFAAWVAGVPVAARMFGSFTVGGLVANMAVLPLAACLVSFGMTGMACGFVMHSAAAFFNNLAALMAWLMCTVSEVVASLPFSSFTVEPWSWRKCLAWYALWACAGGLARAVVKISGEKNDVIGGN